MKPQPASPPEPPSGARPVQHECRRVGDITGLVGDKWSVLVVALLGEGRRRFGELRREVDGISQKVLTATLRRLERDGYVARTLHPTIPPRVDYELTGLGRELLVPVRALGAWAQANRGRVEQARRAYDRRQRDGSPQHAPSQDTPLPDTLPEVPPAIAAE